MKFYHRLLLILLMGGLLLGTLASCGTGGVSKPAQSTADSDQESDLATTDSSLQWREPSVQEKKEIDIYLIVGQSNAAGSTDITDRAAAYEFAPELEFGFSNVLFSGQASDSSYLSWKKIKLGMGTRSGEQFGPEAGMAKALSVLYNRETGKTAGFIKVAYGGTNLLNDVTSGGSTKYGNWVSPSYAEANHLSYDSDSLTGRLYRNFLAIVKQRLSTLEYYGYSSFRIKGLYWMQGENDRDNPREYKIAFQYFVWDLRFDLAEIVEEMTGGDDRGVSEMPIFVGTISKTFDSATDASVATNEAFIRMQKSLAELPDLGPVIVIDNSEYAINKAEGSRSEVVGSNQYHWNQRDQLAIGENVGKAFLEYYSDHVQ